MESSVLTIEKLKNARNFSGSVENLNSSIAFLKNVINVLVGIKVSQVYQNFILWPLLAQLSSGTIRRLNTFSMIFTFFKASGVGLKQIITINLNNELF